MRFKGAARVGKLGESLDNSPPRDVAEMQRELTEFFAGRPYVLGLLSGDVSSKEELISSVYAAYAVLAGETVFLLDWLLEHTGKEER